MPTTLPDPTLAVTEVAIRGPVLLATDGRDGADDAALAARWIAGRIASRLDVVAVLPPLVVYVPGLEGTALPPEVEEGRRADLESEVRRRLARALGASARPRVLVRDGPTGRAIAEAARELGAGLVVAGAGGRRAVDRLLGDEVALQVARHASAPVLAVARGLRLPLRRAVVGVDFGAASVRAARAVLALVDADGADDGERQVTLVHVRAPLDDVAVDTAGWVAEYEAGVGAMFARLRELLHPFLPPCVTLETRIRAGGVVECLRAAADETGATLVAVGTRGPGWAERLFVGSVAAGALRKCEASVLVAPTPSPAERVRLELAVAGHVALERAGDWGGALDAVTRRNGGRRARLEVGLHGASGHAVEADRYRFLGASYDPHDRRVEIMLGDDDGRARHLTHGITHVRAVDVVAGSGGGDRALLVEDEGGETVLTFLD